MANSDKNVFSREKTDEEHKSFDDDIDSSIFGFDGMDESDVELVKKTNNKKIKKTAVKEYKQSLKEKKPTREKKLKKEKRAKEEVKNKKGFLAQMKTLGILVVLGIFTGSGLGVWYYNNMLRSNVDYDSLVASDYMITESEMSTIWSHVDVASESQKVNWFENTAKTPQDLSAVENFTLAEYNAKQSLYYTAIGNGGVNTLGITQPIYSAKKRVDDTYTFESISSGIVSVASCDVLQGNSVKQYSGKGTATNATWTYSSTVTKEGYQSTVGTLPSDIQPYIISDKTVKSSSDVTLTEDGNYTFTMSLHKIYSVINYAKQVKKTGGLSGYPEFNNIELVVVIDPNWNLVSISIEESYSAVAFGMKVTCKGTLVTDFKFYDNGDDITLPV